MKFKYIFLPLTIVVLLSSHSNAQRNYNQIGFKKAPKVEKFIPCPHPMGGRGSSRKSAGESTAYYQTDMSRGMGSSSSNNESYPAENEMVFEVRSLMNVKATKYLAVFNITQVGETAEQTNNLLNERLNLFISGIKALGIHEKDVYTDMIYLIPTFEFEVEKKLFSKTYNEVPAGFEMQKNVHIGFSDIGLIDKLVTTAAKSEIYDLVKLDFFVEDTEAILDTLRDKSLDNMNKKISSLKKMGLDLTNEYKLVYEGSNVIYPESQYSDYDAFVTQSIDVVKKKSVSQVRKPKTVAYDQLSYSQFDIIVNPEILQPVIQYIYVLTVKYVLKTPPKDKNQYLIVTPNGDVKDLNVR